MTCKQCVNSVSPNMQWAFLVVLFASIKYLNMLKTYSGKVYSFVCFLSTLCTVLRLFLQS